MENDVNITYQVMGRQKITQNIIYENYKENNIFKYTLIISFNQSESTRI